MTPREQLLAAREAIDAQIKALDAEPDYKALAWEICEEHGYVYKHTREHSLATAALRRGMELASAPAEPVDVKALVSLLLDDLLDPSEPLPLLQTVITKTIRATLAALRAQAPAEIGEK